jgi:hypothetical protein
MLPHKRRSLMVSPIKPWPCASTSAASKAMFARAAQAGIR